MTRRFPSLRKSLLGACIAALAAGPVLADELAEVEQKMEAFIGVPVVESVRAMPYGGLFEVVLDNGQLLYTDRNATFLIEGRIVDTATRTDVTQARLNELSAIEFSSLPLERAIKQVRGNGERVLVTFEDPNCGYCKRLARELTEVDNLTHYLFLYPILNPDSEKKSRNIWCAKDQVAAWNNWILEGDVPPDAKCDSSVIDANREYGRSLRISGTPTMFLADGQRVGGFVPVDRLTPMLDKVLAADK